MNRKGQTLILFVILIPIILLIAAVVIDTGILMNEHLRLSSLTTTVLKETFPKRKEITTEEILEYYQKNNVPTDAIVIHITDASIEIQNEYDVESVFGKMIGIQGYKINVHKKIVENQDDYKIIEE